MSNSIFKQKAKAVMLITSLALVLSIGIGVSVAYIKSITAPIENTFTPASVSCAVNESFNGVKKENVSIKNTGNVSAYIRVMITVTWQIETQTNQILAQSPVENVDYKITLANNAWVRGSDGYWYYKEAVAPDDMTAVLFSSVEPLGEAPAGYKLSFAVHAQAIQSAPETVVVEQWGVTVTDGKIFPDT